MDGVWYYAAGSGGVYGRALYAASPGIYRSGVVRSGPRIFPEDRRSQLGSVFDRLVPELVCIGEIED